jgi:hypothetical protein
MIYLFELNVASAFDNRAMEVHISYMEVHVIHNASNSRNNIHYMFDVSRWGDIFLLQTKPSSGYSSLYSS